jgi:hypothetical protein
VLEETQLRIGVVDQADSLKQLSKSNQGRLYGWSLAAAVNKALKPLVPVDGHSEDLAKLVNILDQEVVV